MNTKWQYRILVLVAFVLAGSAVWAQKLPERSHIRKGNRSYEQGAFAEAQDGYREALKLDSMSVEALFNMGDAQYASEEFEAAEQTFTRLAEGNGRLTDEQKAQTYYNLGNTQFKQQKLQEALESYKESLRLNPKDEQAKYNYVYTKRQLSENQNQQNQQNQDQNQQNQDQNQQGQNQQNQDQNQNQNPNKDQNQNQQNKPEEQNNPEEQENQGDKPTPGGGEQNQPKPQPQPSKMSEQMLDAVQHAEDQTREKIEAQQVVGVGASGKNW
jgi:tetratricopeptide (TPR) repeat protein